MNAIPGYQVAAGTLSNFVVCVASLTEIFADYSVMCGRSTIQRRGIPSLPLLQSAGSLQLLHIAGWAGLSDLGSVT